MNTQIASGSDARRTGLARNVRRTLSAVAALAATCALAPAALADPATAVTHQPYTGSNVSGTYTGGTATNQFAGVFSLTVTSEGATTETFAYCIALNVGGISGTYTEGDWATSGISNLGKVAWVLNNSFPQKTLAQLNAIDLDGDGTANDADEELESNATAAGATQASIWHFTNGFVPTGGFSAPQQALYNYLTTHAVDLVQPVPALDVKPETGVSGIAGSDVGPFTVEIVDGVATLSLDPAAAGFGIVDGAGNPVSTVGDGSGADSKDVFVRTPVGAGSGSVNLAAVSNEVTLLAGRVFKQTGKQTLILAKSSTVKKDDFEVASYTAASFDAKVTKTVTSNAQGKIGYSIVVKNNGNVPATFSVTDQVPDGLMYLAADNAGNGWNAGDVNGPGSKSQSVTLAAGASKTLAIVLRLESADPAGNLRLCNTATAPTSVVVNGHTITESAGTQGDNSSQACTTVSPRYDLALRKTISSTLALGEATSSTVVDVADVVPFEIRVFNQGNMVASNITVTDHVPAGFAFVASLNPGWVDNGNGRVSRVIAGPLAPGAQTAVMLNLVVDGDAAPGNLLNIAEISSDNGDDVDSTTDLNPGNDVLIDDEITKTPATGDEDDHDVASVTLREFDLALRKTTTSVTVNPGRRCQLLDHGLQPGSDRRLARRARRLRAGRLRVRALRQPGLDVRCGCHVLHRAARHHRSRRRGCRDLRAPRQRRRGRRLGTREHRRDRIGCRRWRFAPHRRGLDARHRRRQRRADRRRDHEDAGDRRRGRSRHRKRHRPGAADHAAAHAPDDHAPDHDAADPGTAACRPGSEACEARDRQDGRQQEGRVGRNGPLHDPRPQHEQDQRDRRAGVRPPACRPRLHLELAQGLVQAGQALLERRHDQVEEVRHDRHHGQGRGCVHGQADQQGDGDRQQRRHGQRQGLDHGEEAQAAGARRDRRHRLIDSTNDPPLLRGYHGARPGISRPGPGFVPACALSAPGRGAQPPPVRRHGRSTRGRCAP